jgi:O-antigen ligase
VDRTSRISVAALPVALAVALALLGRVLPGYFANPRYLISLILLQVLFVCLWFYEQLFFPLLMVAFLWAGMNVPLSEQWTMGRWAILGAGALFGIVRFLRTGVQRYHAIHAIASCCVASAVVSAMVSEVPILALLKALSLFLLFLYGAFGGRLILSDADRFFRRFLFACEIGVYASAFSYLVVGKEIWGSDNSLGAVQGVVFAPLLMWGALAAEERSLRVRRGVACLGALFLVYFSVTRAAMLAATAAILVFLVSVRRHKLILKGLLGLACLTAITAIVKPRDFDELKSSIISGVIYKGHEDQGLLGSRLTPWQETLKVIESRPYFGSGFGTSISGDVSFGEVRRFASTSALREHGSSYLAITEWVGLLGILPFGLLLMILIRAIARVFSWTHRTGNLTHYSVPIMMVVTAGLVHAGFEDWMFAAGYYLTVLFWTLAFLLIDLVPTQAAVSHAALQHGARFRYPATAGAVRQ